MELIPCRDDSFASSSVEVGNDKRLHPAACKCPSECTSNTCWPAPVITATRPGPITTLSPLSCKSMPLFCALLSYLSAAVEEDELPGEVRTRRRWQGRGRSDDLSAEAIRPRATLDAICACGSGDGRRCVEAVGVERAAHDGLTRMPREPELLAAALVSAFRPALAAAETTVKAEG